MATLACEIAPITLLGGNSALFVCGLEVPFEKAELKLTTKKTDITSTASYSNGIIYEEHSPGATSGELSWDTKWRASTSVAPPNLRQGAIYPVQLYVVRAGAVGPGNAGTFYAMNVFIDSNALTFDPKNGTIEWKISATVTGPVTYNG